MSIRALLPMIVAAACASASASAPPSPMRNGAVLYHAFALADGGGYKWASTGCPEEIVFGGERILARSAEGTYCCGYTFTVFMRAAGELGLLEGRSADEVRRIQKAWYGATSESAERQIAFAMTTFELGTSPVPDEAAPGDFVQFWRTTKSGHSAVFLGWIIDEAGARIGLRYRSSQPATEGVGVHAEYFNGAPGQEGRVDPARLYFGRVR